MKKIENSTYDEERALYGEKSIYLVNCSFDGKADGESALKEASDIKAENCFFNLRYPCWHNRNLSLLNCEMTKFCRAGIWYSENIEIESSKLYGIKALRECRNVFINRCDIISPEFAWSVNNITMKNSKAESEYFMMRSENIKFENVEFNGKYSFQYIKNAEFDRCDFNTKDAFWHGCNVTISNSTIKGEYLAWYSDGLTFVNCKIYGTQPFCYCRNLKLVNCEMYDTDLCFEKSEVQAEITTHIISVKNIASGLVKAVSVGEIIKDDKNSEGAVEITTHENRLS